MLENVFQLLQKKPFIRNRVEGNTKSPKMTGPVKFITAGKSCQSMVNKASGHYQLVSIKLKSKEFKGINN